NVASLISSTHLRHPRTSIIVTHAYDALSEIADAIFLLDPETTMLHEIDRDQWSQISRLLEPVAGSEIEERVDRPTTSRASQLGGAIGYFLSGTSLVLEACVAAPLRLIPTWRSPLWGVRFFGHYLRAVAGPSAWLYLAVAGAIVGFVSTYFTFRFLPYANYTEPLFIENLLASMGFSLYRILIPLLATILIAARCGAAVASDVGSKSYGRQIDALRTLGADPNRYMLTNILYAFLIGTPVLVAVGYFSAFVASMVVFTASHPEQGPGFWHLHFHRELAVPGQLIYAGTAWLLAKTLVSAFGIGLIAYYRAARRMDSGRAVSQGVTSTILWATLFALVVQFVFAFYEFN
ncbi:MAG: ABC transporter permease, partial [Planctomycetales bacterium]